MINKTFLFIWCALAFTITPISAGFALILIAKNWNTIGIKNRQPYAHSLWILTVAIEALA